MNIKSIRDKALLTQYEFADKLNVCISTVQSWEQKGIEPSYRLKRRIIEFCKQNNIEIE
jgi:DNA-binding transcriptional regulator YiaG